jgi:hypothetical protein
MNQSGRDERADFFLRQMQRNCPKKLYSGNVNKRTFTDLNQITMASFGELKPNTYYLIQVDEESDIELVSVILETKETVLLRSYLPETEDFFKLQDELIYKLVEEVDEDTAAQFESLYQQATEEQTAVYEEDEEE